jgi:hypothetical protein
MITQAAGLPNMPFFINYQPVFDAMHSFTSSYSRLLQNSRPFWVPGNNTSVHINPRAVEGMLSKSRLGKHVNVIG